MADKDVEQFMRRRLYLTTLAAAFAIAPVATAQIQVGSAPPSIGIDARTAALASARSQAFTTTIQGNALTSARRPLARTVVRLRDARYGRVMDSAITDPSGMFAFRGVDPGSYIVEIMASDQTSVLAASEILTVNAGDVVSAVVMLPFRTTPFAGILAGDAAASPTATTAWGVVAEAAASGVLIVAAPFGAVDTCPGQRP